MGKLSVSLPDFVSKIIEEEGKKPGKNRSSFVAEAVEFFVGKGRTLLTSENELAETKKSLLSKENELFHLSKKNQSLENQVAELSKKLESQVGSLEDKVGQLEEDLSSSRNQLQEAMNLKIKYESSLQAKVDEISFLHAHISQLTQTVQLALPPSKEEVQAKHWWQFWK